MTKHLWTRAEIAQKMEARKDFGKPQLKPVVISSSGDLAVDTEMQALCKWEGCPAWGNQRVMLKIYPIGEKTTYSSLEFADAHYCEKHACVLEVKDVVNSEGWEKIKSAFQAAGHSDPDRETVEILFKTMFDDGGLH